MPLCVCDGRGGGSRIYPEVSHSVDLKGEINHVVGHIKKLLSSDDSSIVHQNCHVTNLFFHL